MLASQTPGRLPHQAKMEGAFDTDLSGTTAITGAEDLMGELNASAAAFLGGSLVFADSNPSEEQVAHEVTHYLQGAEGSAGAGAGQPGDDAEREAGSIARAVAAGQKAPPVRARASAVNFDGPGPTGGLVLDLRRRRPFSYYPERALDIVWTETGTAEQVAADLYLDASLAGRLTEVTENGQHGFRFEPGLLSADWRTVYYEHTAKQGRGQDSTSTPVQLLSLTPTLQTNRPGPIAAVVIYMPGQAGLGTTMSEDSRLSFGRDQGLTGRQSLLAPISGSPRVADTGVSPTGAWDPTTEYGQPVGNLNEITAAPGRYRDLLSRSDDHRVVVNLSTASGYGHLISSRATQMTAPGDPLGFQSTIDPFGGGTHLPGSFRQPQQTDPFGALPRRQELQIDNLLGNTRHGPNLDILQMALQMALQTNSLLGAGSGTDRGTRLLLKPDQDQRPVILLDPTGKPGMYRDGRFMVFSGPRALQMMQTAGAAPTFGWAGDTRLNPVTSIASLPQSLLTIPSSPLTLPQGQPLFDLGTQSRYGLNPHDPFGLNHSPFTTSQPPRPPTFSHTQVMTVGEIRKLVRRQQAQDMLTSAKDHRGNALDVDGQRLANMMTDGVVMGTGHDRKARVDTGAADAGPEPADFLSAGKDDLSVTLDLFELARMQLGAVIDRHSALAELLSPLRMRMLKHEQDAQANPEQTNTYHQLITHHLRLISQCSHQLTLLPGLKERYTHSRECHDELEAIEDLYGLAMVFSDQTASAQKLYTAAEKRMVLFPLFAVQVTSSERGEEVDDLLEHEGDDSWLSPVLMSKSVEDEREEMRSVSEQANDDDIAGLKAAHEKAQAAADGGNIQAAAEAGKLAVELQQKIEGRFAIISQLHQALLAYQHIARSGGKYFQFTTDSNEKVEHLIDRLQGSLSSFETAEDVETRSKIMQEIQELWESEAEYKAFYKDIYDFIEWSDFGVRVAILVAAGLVTMGAGSAAVGAGMVAAEGLGALVLEAAVFTGAHYIGEKTIIGGDRNAGIIGLEDESGLAGEGMKLAGDFAVNLAMFGAVKQIGKLWQGLGKEGPAAWKTAGQLTSTFALFEAAGIAQYAWKKGELPDSRELLKITGQNALSLAAMHVAGSLAKPWFDKLQLQAAKGAGNYEQAMHILESRRGVIQGEVGEMLTEANSGGTINQRRLGQLTKQAEGLQKEAAELQTRLNADPTFAEKVQKNPALAEALQADMARLQQSAEMAADITFGARVGLRTGGGSAGERTMLFDRGQAEVVAEFYSGRGFTLKRTTLADGRVQLTASKGGEKLFLSESRTASSEGFSQGYTEGGRTTVESKAATAETTAGVEQSGGITAVIKNTPRSQSSDGSTLDVLNHGSYRELILLEGIGPAKAARLIDARAGGKFESILDIANIPGIGAPLANKLSLLSLNPSRSLLDLINTGDAKALTEITDIGLTRAENIVEHRATLKDGKFTSIEKLSEVHLIGEKLARNIQAREKLKFVREETAAEAQPLKGTFESDFAQMRADPANKALSDYELMKQIVKGKGPSGEVMALKGEPVPLDILEMHGAFSRVIGMESVYKYHLTADAKAELADSYGITSAKEFVEALKRDPGVFEESMLDMSSVITGQNGVAWWAPRGRSSAGTAAELIQELALSEKYYQGGAIRVKLSPSDAFAGGFRKPTAFDGMLFGEWVSEASGNPMGVTRGGSSEAVAPAIPLRNMTKIEVFR